jgi:prophage antirepressor-like protein
MSEAESFSKQLTRVARLAAGEWIALSLTDQAALRVVLDSHAELLKALRDVCDCLEHDPTTGHVFVGVSDQAQGAERLARARAVIAKAEGATL